MPHIIFTGLEDYKARGTQAAPYFTVSYYKEFAESKGLVLIRGDVVFTSKLSDTEAKWPCFIINSTTQPCFNNLCFPETFFQCLLSLQENLQKLQERALPGGFVKWGSLGFCRTSRFATGFTPLQPKPLDSIMDVERVKDRSPEDITSIWDDYHLGRSHIGASMRANLYYLLEQRAADCRYFVIPLWRGSGYTTMFAQVQMPHIIFTGLEDYKARGTQAAPYFTLSYYKEFAESKGLVLICGDVVFSSKLSDTEAKWLLETAQSFYLNDARYKLVEQFNKKTHDFEFQGCLASIRHAHSVICHKTGTSANILSGREGYRQELSCSITF